MGLFSRFIAQKVRVAIAQVMRGGQPKMIERNATAYTKEGYKANVIVFRCVDVIAKAVASIPILTRRGDEVLYDHPLLKLLARPNPMQAWSDFCQTVVAYRLITGNSFQERLTISTGATTELWPWSPYNMKVVASDESRIVRGYAWDDGKNRHGWEVDERTGISDILHWKTFNPLDERIGMSPIEACAFAVDQHNAAGKWNLKMLQNSAEPSGVLKSEQTLTDPQFKQLKDRLDQQYSGPDNARRAMILDGGFEWSQISLSPKDMDWLQGRNVSAQDIAAAYGVPLQVIPLPGSQTFANYEQARLALYEDVAIPLLENLLDEYNRWLGPSFGDGVELGYDLDEVPALQPRRSERWISIQNANWLTINEKREATGYDRVAIPEADQILIQSSMIPLQAELDTESTDDEEEVIDPTKPEEEEVEE